MKTAGYVLTSLLGVLSLGVCAAEAGTNTTERSENRQGGRRPPESPVIKALDANGDGVIDASEIANASAALKKLDKNGDGKLTRDEIMPAHQRGKGGAGGPGGKDGGQPPPPGE